MQDRHLRHRSGRTHLKTAAVLIALILIWLIWKPVVRELCALIFGAAVIAFLLAPLSRLLERKLSRPLASLIALTGVLALFILALTLLLPALFRQLTEFVEQLPEAFSRLRTLAEALEARIRRQTSGLQLPKFSLDGAQANLADALRGTIATVGSAANCIYRCFLTVMLSYFLLTDREQILLRLEWMIPRSQRKNAVLAGNMLLRELRLYLRGQATIALAVGAIAALGLKIIGLQGAVLLGVLVGLFNAIPYFGPFLGGIPAMLTALSVGWEAAALTLLCLFLVQQIDGALISPRVMGSVTGFSPAMVMLALFAGARVGSIIGMLMAMPVLMAVRTLYRVFVQQHKND